MEAVTAEHGPMGPLLGKLTSLLADECGRLKGVRREIRSLRSELTSMHAALREYTKLEDPNEQVKAWISLVRELAYDTEDCFDKFIHQLGNGGDHGGFKEFFRETARRLKTLGSRRGIADQIDDLQVRIKQVKELKDGYKLDETSSGTTRHAAVDPRLHALFVEEAHLVGIDGQRDDLVEWMLKEGSGSTKHPRVLSIVGFGGLGKTTLANQVYRKIQGHFHCRAFVALSQKPDTTKIIKDVIFDVISQLPCKDGFTKDVDSWDERICIDKLRELLHDKRYLIIVDDIWSTSAWDTIKCAFSENNCSSRIIVTTRIVDVAKSCCLGGDVRVYEMKALDEIHSRRLFFKRIFGSEDSCPPMMKEVSNKILKKCGGLPLAIISISGLLANKPVVREEWEKVNRSIGSAREKNQSLDGMSSILSLSYNDLTPNLKTCLLYLSIFPKDYIIARERLVRRWIAEGFVSEERGQSQQEVAENYFHELINKSMVQPVDISGYDGKARACRVHDMMLELIVSKSVEDNFVTVVGSGQTCLANRQGLIRRLSVQHIDQEVASALRNEDLSHVRSLTVASSCCIKHLPSLGEFEALRVLDFEDCREGVEEYIMNGMDKLFRLKYIGLKGTGISKLPPRIVKLHDLETLDLRDTSVQELPPGIHQLIKLQHILSYCCHVPDGIGNMRNLRAIPRFDITRSSVGAVEELGNLTRLNELRVHLGSEGSDKYKRHKEMLLSSIRKLGNCKLQSLYIEGSEGSLEFLESLSPLPSSLQQFHMVGAYYLTDIRKQIVPAALNSLAALDINVTELSEEGLQALGELPALLSVALSFKTEPKERFIVQGFGFPSLKKFRVFTIFDRVYITFAKGAMPKLEYLEVPFCVSQAKPHGFYSGIEHLPCLRHVEAGLCNEGATSSDSRAAAAALRKEAGAHQNHPTIKVFGEPDEEDSEETGGEETGGEDSEEDGGEDSEEDGDIDEG